MSRKYLPFTIAKSFKHSYVEHAVADFETCFTSEARENVRVWAWGFLDYINGAYEDGTEIKTFFDRILTDRKVYDIGFHNLKFDGSFIIPYLFKLGYEYMPNDKFMDKWTAGDDMKGLFTHNITTNNQWFSITIAKATMANSSTPAFVHIWDTYKLFPKKLSEIGLQYNTDSQKMQVDADFYEAIRPAGHQLTDLERAYLRADCATLAEALRSQLKIFGTIYRTQASKAFTFFKNSCVDEAGNVNYKQKYEGIQQWTVPEIAGLEDYRGATVRYLPKAVRRKIDASGVKLTNAFEYYIPDFYTWADFKRAYNGGIAYVNPIYAERSINAPVTVIDVNSMYPYCLRTFPIPYGRFTRVEGMPDLKSQGTWIACARVSFKLKSDHHLPCIQMKERYGREWLRESTDYKKYGEEDPYNEDILYFTAVDFETFCENYDFTVHRWIFHYKFGNWSNRDGKTFIDHFYKQKQNADNVMQRIKREKPETYRTDPEYQKAALERQEAKIAMNSAYGKHGTKYFLYSKDSVFHGADEPIEYVAETSLGRDPAKEPSHYYCPYAAFVTAYARQMLVRTWNAFGGRALYCDTDSIHFLGTPDEIPEALHSSIDWEKTGALGLWKIEEEFAKARYIRAKTYIEVKADGSACVTCAGATPEIKRLMNWDTFRVGFNAWAVFDSWQTENGDRWGVLEAINNDRAADGLPPIGKDRLTRRDFSKLTPKQYPDGIALEYVNFEINPFKLS